MSVIVYNRSRRRFGSTPLSLLDVCPLHHPTPHYPSPRRPSLLISWTEQSLEAKLGQISRADKAAAAAARTSSQAIEGVGARGGGEEEEDAEMGDALTVPLEEAFMSKTEEGKVRAHSPFFLGGRREDEIGSCRVLINCDLDVVNCVSMMWLLAETFVQPCV